jgi:transcriptional regulator GlxA family with amidase domain
MDLTHPRAGDFMRTLRFTQDEAARPQGLAHHPVLASQVARLVSSSLILSQPHNFSDALFEPSPRMLHATVGTVVDAIEADPMRVATAADLAVIARLSLRTLEQRFARHLGMAPMAYVRRVRLERARAELQQSDPGAMTVTAIAQRWGFTHTGRFAATYQQRYGESPSQTLQRR